MEINIFIFFININCLICILKINRKEIDPKLFTSDDDYLYYFYQLYLSPAPTEEFIPIIKDYFTLKGNDTMVHIFSDIQYFTQFFYTSILSIYDNKQSPSIMNNLFKNYTLFFLNQTNFFLDIKINPCLNFKQYCCEGLGQCLEDNLNITGKKDLEIAYIFNNFLPICGREYQYKCGTFLEIHMSSNPLIMQEKQITSLFNSGYKTIFLSTKSLCSGRYELWIVIRMRDFNYIIYIKPFNVLFPSCTCKEIALHGYICE